jgi:Protein of unknown function (DUF2933)
MNHNRMHTYLLGAAAIAAVLVIAKVPLAGILPFGVLLLCPLMMIFMMKGMSSMGSKEDDHTGHGCEHDPTPKADKTAGGEPADHRFS